MKTKTRKKKFIDPGKPIWQLSDNEFLDVALTNIEAAKTDKSDDWQRCEEYRNIYLNLDPPDDVIDEASGDIQEDERIYSNTSLPIGGAMVDAAAAQLYNIVFPNDDYFQMDAQAWEDEISAHVVTAHMKERHREMRFRYKVYEAIQAMLSFDYVITGCRWLMEPGFQRKRVIREALRDLAGFKERHRQVDIELEWVPWAIDRSDMFLIDYFKCAHDKRAKHGLEDSTFFCDWFDEPIENLRAKQQSEDRPWGKYRNIDAALKKIIEGMQPNRDPNDPADTGTEQVANRAEIHRYWTKHHVGLICGEQVIFRQNLDGWPLQQWGCFLVPGEFRKMGLLERMQRSALDINAIINNRRNVENLVADPIAVVDDGLEGIDDTSKRVYPGKQFTNPNSQKNPKDLLHIHQPDASFLANSEEIGIQLDAIKMVTGIGDNAMGQFASGRRSAREASFVQSGMVSRATQVAANIETMCLVPFYETQFKYEQSYLTRKETFKYMGPEGIDWLTIKPEHYKYAAMPRFEPKGAAFAAGIEMRLQLMLKGAELGMMLPQIHNLENIFAELWQMLAPKNWRKFVKDPRDRTHNIPPAVENMMFGMGHDVEISPQNDHKEHLASHQELTETPDFQTWPEAMKLKVKQHMHKHQQQIAQTAVARRGIVNPAQDQSDMMRGMRDAATPS